MIRRFGLALALGLVVAAVVAPTALAKPVSSDVLNGGYDPWAYGLIYKSTHASTTQQNLGPLDPWAYALVHKGAATPAVVKSRPLSPIESRTFYVAPATSAVGTTKQNLGPLDPWAYALVHKSAATPAVVTTHSSGFDYGDAGIGAAVSFGIALILLGTVVVGLKYRRNDRSGFATS